jgi:hypothetical protein
VGGWRRAPRGVDSTLIEDVIQVRERIYRTHGADVMTVRDGYCHTWDVSDDSFDSFLAQADSVSPGWNPALADIPATSGAGRRPTEYVVFQHASQNPHKDRTWGRSTGSNAGHND